MNVISIKDYAKQRNVSYEAIRQQVVRYADELGEHIIKDGRQQFLDDEAVAFLDAKRKKNPVAIYQIEKDEEIERLKAEKERILLELAGVQKQLIQAQQENRFLIEENSKIALLQADNEAARREASEISERLRATEDVAEINAQERDRERERAEAAEVALQEKKEEADILWERMKAMKNRNLIERILNKKID